MDNQNTPERNQDRSVSFSPESAFPDKSPSDFEESSASSLRTDQKIRRKKKINPRLLSGGSDQFIGCSPFMSQQLIYEEKYILKTLKPTEKAYACCSWIFSVFFVVLMAYNIIMIIEWAVTL